VPPPYTHKQTKNDLTRACTQGEDAVIWYYPGPPPPEGPATTHKKYQCKLICTIKIHKNNILTRFDDFHYTPILYIITRVPSSVRFQRFDTAQVHIYRRNSAKTQYNFKNMVSINAALINVCNNNSQFWKCWQLILIQLPKLPVTWNLTRSDSRKHWNVHDWIASETLRCVENLIASVKTKYSINITTKIHSEYISYRGVTIKV
jgi:hypothetical protein